MTVVGESSARQIGGLIHAGASGRWGKTQPPAARKLRQTRIGGDVPGRDQGLCGIVVLDVRGITSQELDGELFSIENVISLSANRADRQSSTSAMR